MKEPCTQICIDDLCRSGSPLCGATFCAGCGTSCFFDDAYCNECRESNYESERDDEFECCFPGSCIMPGYHMRSECATAEMMEQLYEEGEA